MNKKQPQQIVINETQSNPLQIGPFTTICNAALEHDATDEPCILFFSSSFRVVLLWGTTFHARLEIRDCTPYQLLFIKLVNENVNNIVEVCDVS